MWTDKKLMRHEIDVYSLRLMDGERVVAYVEGVEGGRWYARHWPTGKLIGEAASQSEAMTLAESCCPATTTPV
jgi:hypothetical protein